MKINKRIPYISLIILTGTLFTILFSLTVNSYVKSETSGFIFNDTESIPNAYCGLVLGAKVYKNGELSPVTQDRIITAFELYKKGKIKRILVSGDHGQEKYDETNTMKKHLLLMGIPGRDIFTDHAGFNTYNSVVRARRIFHVKNMIIITQEFHLNRSVYIARKNGIKAYGIISDKRKYLFSDRYEIREYLARVKSFLEVFFNINPVYLGRAIPITGSSRASWD